MTQAHTLTRHRDIQAWVIDRHGMPAMVRAHDSFGELRARLALRFANAKRNDTSAVSEDGVTFATGTGVPTVSVAVAACALLPWLVCNAPAAIVLT